MAPEMIPKEKMDYTIDANVTMVVEELAEQTGKERSDILPDFISSKTGRSLYDPSTGFWKYGPSYLVDLYLEERSFLWKDNGKN